MFSLSNQLKTKLEWCFFFKSPTENTQYKTKNDLITDVRARLRKRVIKTLPDPSFSIKLHSLDSGTLWCGEDRAEWKLIQEIPLSLHSFVTRGQFPAKFGTLLIIVLLNQYDFLDQFNLLTNLRRSKKMLRYEKCSHRTVHDWNIIETTSRGSFNHDQSKHVQNGGWTQRGRRVPRQKNQNCGFQWGQVSSWNIVRWRNAVAIIGDE